ncbi:MAG TPA: hemolysin family protein [bacterium]|nr:hemolysin family protein [bacterium]HNS49478.1 hemolysin family protein [bacterium]
MIFAIIVLVILLLFSAYFSAAETALTSLGKLKVKALIEKEGRRAEVLNLWLKEPSRYLTTILVANNIVNIVAASLSTYLAIENVPEQYDTLATGIATFCITLLILVMGEIVPKTFARQNSDRLALFFFPSMLSITYLIHPVVQFFVSFSDKIIRLLGGHLAPQATHISTEELQTLIDIGEEEGALAAEEREMLTSVIEFRETEVSEVMTPRVTISALPEDASIGDALALMVKDKHSRLPIYRDSMDEIVGVVDSRQVLGYISEGERNLLVRQVMRPPFFVPEMMRVSELLKEFKRRKLHLAIVIDEYGGTAGLVTLEDLLEEIVGEIQDEYEVESSEYQTLAENTYLANAKMEIEKANQLLKLDIEDDDTAETLAGFVLNRLGHIPQKGEQVRYHNFLFTVEQADERTVNLLRIQKLTPRVPHEAS